jgi:hypothetical protein
MSTFTEQVRESKISHPTKKSFTLSKWEKSFKESAASTEEDMQLFNAGIWIFKEFENIREKLKDAPLNFLPKRFIIRLLCGDTNRSLNLVHRRKVPKLTEDTFSVEQVLQAKISGNIFGFDYRPDDLLTTEIDGARFPLIYVSNFKENHSKIKYSDLEILHKIWLMKILGQYYDILESIWEDCLWNGLIIDQTGTVDIIFNKDRFFMAIKAVAQYREQHLGMEFVLFATSMWRSELDDGIKRHLGERYIVTFHGAGKKRDYNLQIEPYNPERIPSTLIFRLMAQESYFDDLVNLEMPKYFNLTLEHLFASWEIIYSLSEALMDKLPEDDSIKQINKLGQFAPSIKKVKLAKLFSKGLGIDNALAQNIVDLLTFKPEPNCEIWTHPLIELDSQTVIPVFTAAISGNLLRTLEYWLKNSGIDFSDKGYLFEKTIRKSTELALKNSSKIKDYFVCPSSITFSSNDQKEELDLIIRIGNKLLLGEAKCIIYPTEPLNYFNYLKSIKHGIEQIKRKADLIKNKLEEFLISNPEINMVHHKTLEIIPFVITNRSLCVGFLIDGIPILDLLVLNKYFRDGKWEKFAFVDQGGEKTVGETQWFYKTEEEAIENIKEYIINPPQINFYKKFIKIKKYPVLRLHKEDKNALLLIAEVEIPVPEAKF